MLYPLPGTHGLLHDLVYAHQVLSGLEERTVPNSNNKIDRVKILSTRETSGEVGIHINSGIAFLADRARETQGSILKMQVVHI